MCLKNFCNKLKKAYVELGKYIYNLNVNDNISDYSDDEKTKEILDTMCSIYDITFEQRHLLKD